MSTTKIEKNFRIYRDKTESDYHIKIDGQVVPTLTTILTPEDGVKRNGNVTIYPKKFIDNLSPDKIDSRKFWFKATTMFPLYSIAGGVQTYKTTDEANKGTLNFANTLGVLDPVNNYFINNPEAKILEIGPGHGGFLQYITYLYGSKNFYCIDVNPLFMYPRMFRTTGKTISNSVPNNLDIVYSFNVFQHLSKDQRSGYYKRISKKLKKGGIFIFGMFVVTEENKEWPVWGTKDSEGNCYVNFFRQLTLVDKEEELMEELKSLGFEVEKLSAHEHECHYLTFKCTKK